MKETLLRLSAATGLIALLAAPATVAAEASTVVVTPTHTQGWSQADTRTGGTVTYVADTSAPGGSALQLTTDATTGAKAQYMHAANTPLSQVTSLSYATRQVSGPATADPSYQVAVDLNGDGTTDTTLVYEPYWNDTVTPDVWQTWDVTGGQFWSSKAFTDGMCSVRAGAGGEPFYTLSDVTKMCSNAVVTGFGVNVGTNNPSYVVETDSVNFNGTTYDFQLTNAPADKDACKSGGWQNLTTATGNAFKNQGDCVSYVASDGKAKGNPETPVTSQHGDDSVESTIAGALARLRAVL